MIKHCLGFPSTFGGFLSVLVSFFLGRVLVFFYSCKAQCTLILLLDTFYPNYTFDLKDCINSHVFKQQLHADDFWLHILLKQLRLSAFGQLTTRALHRDHNRIYHFPLRLAAPLFIFANYTKDISLPSTAFPARKMVLTLVSPPYYCTIPLRLITGAVISTPYILLIENEKVSLFPFLLPNLIHNYLSLTELPVNECWLSHCVQQPVTSVAP